jgi:parvulin-like peptidyl-prolyl isomerase
MKAKIFERNSMAKVKPATTKKLMDDHEVSDKITKPVHQDLRNNKLYWGLGVLAVLFGLGYAFRSQFVVASVNGQLITRNEYVAAMEAQGGRQVLEQLILERLIKAEATKKNVTVPQEDIDARIATIENNLSQQGQTLDTALAQNSMTREQFMEQVIKTPLLLEILSAENVVVTDEEIEAYIEENKEMLKSITDQDELKATVKEQLTQGKTQEASQAFMESLQTNAEIRYW